MPYLAKKPHKKESLTSANATGPVTFERFYEIVEENVKADLLDGKIIRDSPAIPRHSHIVSRFHRLIGDFAGKFDLGEVFGATATVRLSKYQGPEPDVFFIRKSRLRIMGEKYIAGPPDLCIEVISKSSRKIDRGRKFVLYAEHGVKEYWIADPLRNTAEFYENHDGEWVEIKPAERGRLHSKVLPGFWFNPKWLSKDLLPPVSEMLQEILGV
ncbi:MAG: Uma2 family endonuclease [bacterium]